MEAPLGTGGAARVFRVRDEATDLQVALKLFPPNRVSEAEFRREAAIAMRMRHPNLVALIDAGMHEQQPYLALEFVDGPNLRTWMSSYVHTPEELLDAARQVFLALDAMHREGLAHGDIKPDNALIQDGQVRVVDFGRARLAHLVASDGAIFPGTPAYMHPRLYNGGVPDARTDCFAAWVSTYEMLAQHRPYTMGTLQWAEEDDLGDVAPLEDPALDTLVRAGLTGQLSDARASWLAITRFLRGRRDLPDTRPLPPPVDEYRVLQLQDGARRGRSVALVGDPDTTHPYLEALDRSWRALGGHTLWVRSGWASPDRPLSAALALAANAPDALTMDELARVDRAMGPLGAALASALPPARAWITAVTSGGGTRPEPERLILALRRFVESVPRPLLVLISGLGRIDGSSRRFLGSLVAGLRVTVIGDALPDAPHGLPGEIELASPPRPPPSANVPRVVAELVRCARLLNLPFGPLLARATGVPLADVEDAALEAEHAGLARFDGEAVLAEITETSGDTLAGALTVEGDAAVFREAARRLEANDDPIRVARYALRGDDDGRLAEVIDAAVAEALRLDPAEALALLAADPRPPTPARLMRHLRVALLARDVSRAEELLAALRARNDVESAELAEAEGELHFRKGETVLALRAYQRAASALGQPHREGVGGAFEDAVAVGGILLGLPPRARPNPQLARIFETLYDLWFCVDHAPLLRVHRRWLAFAPDNARASTMQLLWYTALGRSARAAELERRLLESTDEERDPVGAAVVILHRGMARLWRGETVAAFADGVDAAERLLSVGDPYLAALATTLPTAATVHVASPGPIARLSERLDALVAATGEKRAAAWARGTDAILRWCWGDSQGAVSRARAWCEESARIQDAGEGVARRFLADLHVEAGRHREALDELERCEAVCRRAHLRMDFTDARAIDVLIADGQARRAGTPGVPGRNRWLKRARGLAARSPRWTPRLRIAEAWQRLAEGDTEGAIHGFDLAETDAVAREQTHDAWWALTHRTLALDDEDAFAAAGQLARTHGIKGGEPEG